MRALLSPALGTFAAAIMFTSVILAVVTMVRLNETRAKLAAQTRVVRIQNKQIRSLADVALAQQNLISRQQRMLGQVVNNQAGLFTLIKRSTRHLVVR